MQDYIRRLYCDMCTVVKITVTVSFDREVTLSSNSVLQNVTITLTFNQLDKNSIGVFDHNH